MTNIAALTTLARSTKDFFAELPTEKIAAYLPWVATPTRWPILAAAYGAGVATGAGAALLVAPTSGVELRKQIWKRAEASGLFANEPLKSWFEARRNGADANGAADAVTKTELYEQAKERDIPARSTMTKQQLADALAADVAAENGAALNQQERTTP